MNSSPLDDEMKGILDRADELAKELEIEYTASAQCAVVTERAKNLFHEVLVKIRSSLDFVMCRIYRKYSTLQGKEKAKWERGAAFPICDKADAFGEKLARLGLSRLETEQPELYAKVRQCQPFMTKNKTLLLLRELSNLGKHVRLAKQVLELRPAKRFTGPNGQIAIATEGTVFNDGKSVGPWPDCSVEDITWATIQAYTEDGSRVFPEPVWLCLDLRVSFRSYIQEIILLVSCQF